jgi:hypothetical protein
MVRNYEVMTAMREKNPQRAASFSKIKVKYAV